MRTLLLAGFFFLLTTSAGAQTMVMFEKIFTDSNSAEAYAIEPVDSGYIMCAIIIVDGDYNVALFRLDAGANVIWSKRYDLGTYSYAMDVKPVSTGGFIVAVQKRQSSSAYDVGGLRVDANGNIIWQMMWGGNGSEEVYEVIETSDGGFLFSGRSNSFGLAGAMLLKTNSAGTVLWRKVYHGRLGASYCSAKEVPAGGYVLASQIHDTINSYINHIMLVRTDINGDTIWTSTFGAPGAGGEEPRDLEVCADGSFLISGRTYNFSAGITDVFLAKADANGNFMWAKVYGGYASELTFDTDITSDGGFIVGGWTESFGPGVNNYYLIRTDSLGDTLWTVVTGSVGGDFIYGIAQTPDGGFIAAGGSYPTTSSNYVIYVIKTNAGGYTGCNKTGTPTIVSNAPLQASHLPVFYYSGNIGITAPFTVSNITLGSSYYCSNVGIGESSSAAASVAVYPNPADDRITLSSSMPVNDATISVVNAVGEVVYHEYNFRGMQTSISTAGFANGVYAVIVASDESTSSHKIIVRH
jgi:hypothetical protein